MPAFKMTKAEERAAFELYRGNLIRLVASLEALDPGGKHDALTTEEDLRRSFDLVLKAAKSKGTNWAKFSAYCFTLFASLHPAGSMQVQAAYQVLAPRWADASTAMCVAFAVAMSCAASGATVDERASVETKGKVN